jgi:hypothetical protein
MKRLALSYVLILLALGLRISSAGKREKKRQRTMPSKGDAEPDNPHGSANSTTQDKQNSENSGIKPPRPSGKEAQPHPHHQRNCCDKDKKHWLDYAVFTAAVLAAIGAIAAAGFTAWQASIADEQLEVAKDTAKRQLRAYLSVSAPGNAVRNFEEGKVAHVTVQLDNGGLTPPYKGAWHSGITVEENGNNATVRRAVFEPCTNILGHPAAPEWTIGKQQTFAEKDRIQGGARIPFTKDEINDVKSAKASIYFSGRICYLDIFDEIQAIDFCLYWNWDASTNSLDRQAKYCRHGNGPPNAQRDEYYRKLAVGVK